MNMNGYVPTAEEMGEARKLADEVVDAQSRREQEDEARTQEARETIRAATSELLDITSGLDFLKKLVDIESALRDAAAMELSDGIHDGPMRHAHDKVITDIVLAAKTLVLRFAPC